VYDTERVQRIIGEDGKEKMVTLNQKQQPGQGVDPNGTDAAIAKVLNDVTVGTYDVVMQTGPGYDTRRKEGTVAMMELMGTPVGEKVAAVADDLIIRNMDFPGSDVIADRLAAANPLSKIDEESDVPPQAQMQIKAQQDQIQKMGQAIQQLELEKKYRMDVQGMKEQGATQRTLMETTTKAHDTEERNKSIQHSTEVKALTAQNVEEIRGLVKLLSDKLGNKHQLEVFEREVQQANQEQATKAAESASAQPA
jgi:hypothetical protein